MGLKEYKPTSPGRRDTVADDYKDLTEVSLKNRCLPL